MTFQNEENHYRRLVFEQNLAKISAHNADETQTYEMGVNQFTGLTQEEFEQTYLGAVPPADAELFLEDEILEPITNDIDWTTKGGVSRVKNQGQCGSCWAFSATGVAESMAKIKKGQSVDLSEQQLVDCSSSYGNHGCNGGWPSSALKYVIAKGLASQSEYPYKAKTNSCAKQGGNFKISSQSSMTGCSGLQNGINSEPISVTVDASKWSSYRSGVFSTCGTSINHAVLLVGIVGGNWKIKNSWGTSWGESGYIRLAGGKSTCGVCQYAGTVPK